MKLFVLGLMTLISLSTWAQQGDVVLERGQILSIESLERIDIPLDETRISFECLIIDLVSASGKNRFIPKGTKYEVSLEHDEVYNSRLNNLIPKSSVIKRLIAADMQGKRPRLSSLIECINLSGMFKVEGADLIDTAPEEVR